MTALAIAKAKPTNPDRKALRQAHQAKDDAYHAAIPIGRQKAADLIKAIRDSDPEKLFLQHCQLGWTVLAWLESEPTPELHGEIVGFCSALSTVILRAIHCPCSR